MAEPPAPSREPRAGGFETRVLLLAVAVGLPGALLGLALLWAGPYSTGVRWTLAALLIAAWWALASTLQTRVVRPLRTLANLLSALREGDFSLRARPAPRLDAAGPGCAAVHALCGDAREQ